MIVFCMKDPGGTQAVIPVAKELGERGEIVLLLATGVGAKILANEEKLPFTDVSTIDSILAEKPNMLVSSIDTGEMTIDVTRKARKAGVPVAWIQDLLGNHIKPNWNGTVRPDYFFTFDQLWADEVKRTWPDFPTENIFPLGQPKFDLIEKMEIDPVILAFKESLKQRGVRILTVAGQIRGMYECIGALIKALNMVDLPVFVDFMHHGRCKPEEVEQFRSLYPKLKCGLAVELEGWDRNQRLLLGDVLFTMFSTDAMNAAVLGKHVISCLLPEGRKSFEAEGYTGDFVVARMGACLSVSTHVELIAALNEVLRWLNQRHHNTIEVDGKSVDRIAEKIIELIR